jgi:hypothetical protein
MRSVGVHEAAAVEGRAVPRLVKGVLFGLLLLEQLSLLAVFALLLDHLQLFSLFL